MTVMTLSAPSEADRDPDAAVFARGEQVDFVPFFLSMYTRVRIERAEHAVDPRLHEFLRIYSST